MPGTLGLTRSKVGTSKAMHGFLGGAAFLLCLVVAGAASLAQGDPSPADTGSASIAPPIPPPPYALSEQARKQCAAQNGDYGYWGLSWQPMCNIRFDDGGKTCTDKSDCEGRCLLVGDMPRHNRNVSGQCEPHHISYGCSVPIAHGVAGKAECLE
ncbi:MAG: hypothetical protein KGL29_07835 [Alphaproteobacteria bacterium]|nr:hypothetical protein [Alphaproteobacteria bacterium]